ncbi:hypothetical protein [Roseiterribacter gracilis]|uniref:REDY-like protein HapK n=1 Tax=Roseiterribacter gracilis TaxID=2812848 RepID=A0A8S8XGN6_9PROT|nr:hypothetical protein TMPK1_26730 [Rhodospirillales bacterium TMPK1]
MPHVVVLFNLKQGVEKSAYEAWAQATDLPIVRGLPSIGGFDVYRSLSLFGSEKAPPYQYVELIQVDDMTKFGEDVASATMQRVAGEFRSYADDPLFILCDKLG